MGPTREGRERERRNGGVVPIAGCRTFSLALFLFLLALLPAPLPAQTQSQQQAQAQQQPPSQAPESWLEIRSPHFTVYTDGSVRQGHDVAAHFEQIRAVFHQALPGAQLDPTEPVRILAVRNESEFSRLFPEYWAARDTMHPSGYFSGSTERNYVVLRLDVAADRDYFILYHEYVHVLESLNFPSLPLWISEGLADFYGSVRVFGGQVGVGYPIEQHIKLLSTAQKMPLADLLSTTETSADYIEAGASTIFYAQSWALTDYLLTADDAAHRDSLFRYLALVRQGTGSVAAARQAFGDLPKLAENLAAFLSHGPLPYYTIKAPFAPSAGNLSTRAISTAEADAVRGDFMVFRNRPEEARALLDRAIRLNPNLAAPYASLGMLALRANDRKAALVWFDRAVDQRTSSYLAWYYRALLALRLRKGPGVNRQAESDLEECLRLNPRFAEGYRALADMKSLLKEDPDLAVKLARRAIALKRDAAENHLTLGVIYLRRKDTAAAETEGQRALALSRSEGERGNARRFLDVVAQTRAAIASGAAIVINAPAGGLSGDPLAAAPVASSAPPAAVSPGEVSGTLTTTPAPDSSPAPGIAASGIAQQVKCRGRHLSLVLVSGGARLPLYAPDYTVLRYESTVATSAEFSPCTQLEGRHLTIHYLAAEQKPGGQLTYILVQQ
jgi:tetratricopeptide (TPR) repeat protein